MSSSDDGAGRRRPPGPVIAAVALMALMAGMFVVVAVSGFLSGQLVAALPLAIAVTEGSLAVGLWRGNRGARMVALVLANVSLLTAMFLLGRDGALVGQLVRVLVASVLLALLVAPASTRAHFSLPD